MALAWIGAAWPQASTPAGLWTTFSDSTGKPEGLVRIEERDGEFLGTVVSVFDAAAPNPLCEKCEGALRSQPVIGMTILRGLRRSAGGYDGGTILDPDEGRTYRCTMSMRDDGRRLEIHAYLGLRWFSRTQIWVRAD